MTSLIDSYGVALFPPDEAGPGPASAQPDEVGMPPPTRRRAAAPLSPQRKLPQLR